MYVLTFAEGGKGGRAEERGREGEQGEGRRVGGEKGGRRCFFVAF